MRAAVRANAAAGSGPVECLDAGKGRDFAELLRVELEPAHLAAGRQVGDDEREPLRVGREQRLAEPPAVATEQSGGAEDQRKHWAAGEVPAGQRLHQFVPQFDDRYRLLAALALRWRSSAAELSRVRLRSRHPGWCANRSAFASSSCDRHSASFASSPARTARFSFATAMSACSAFSRASWAASLACSVGLDREERRGRGARDEQPRPAPRRPGSAAPTSAARRTSPGAAGR